MSAFLSPHAGQQAAKAAKAAWIITKSASRLLSASTVTTAGIFMGLMGAKMAGLSDAELLAQEQGDRDVFLAAISFGTVVALLGFEAIGGWCEEFLARWGRWTFTVLPFGFVGGIFLYALVSISDGPRGPVTDASPASVPHVSSPVDGAP